MAFDDRLQYLLLGVGIGFVLGYLVRLLLEVRDDVQDIKEELDEVDEIVKKNLGNHEKNEAGFMTKPWRANLAMLLVVGIAFFAAVQSQKASNDANASLERAQASLDRVKEVVTCLTDTQSLVISALNKRSKYSPKMANANIDLQTSQSEFFSILLHQPPYSEIRREQAVKDYFDDLQTFLKVAQKNQGKLKNNPFPKIADFTDCLNEDATQRED